MKQLVFPSTQDLVDKEWDKLKCSPIGPFLQMLGIAPGDVNETSNLCKSSAFSSQFNSSMSEHVNMTGKLTNSMGALSSTMDKFRNVIASMEQRAFQDLANIATQIFTIYVKIGNIFYVMIKNLINIMNIFKKTVDFGASIAKLLIAFINLLRVPVNGMISFVKFFKRK
jgi:hypothetical protein